MSVPTPPREALRPGPFPTRRLHAPADVVRAEHVSNVNRPDNDTCLVRCAKPFDHEALMAMLSGMDAVRETGASGMRECLVNSTVLLAAYDTGPIGCIMATPGPQTVLHNLVITPAYRGRGHASDLIGATIELLEQDERTQSFWTAIDPRLDGGVRRFERHGFVEVPETTSGEMKLMTRPVVALPNRKRLVTKADPSQFVGQRPVRRTYEASLIG